MKKFNFYETINDIQVEKNSIKMLSDVFVIKFKRKYYYFFDDQKKYIDESILDNSNDELTFELKDPDCEWDESDGIYLELSLEIINNKYLFGEYGIVFDDAKIGIGLEWKPEKSRIKKCVKLGSFTKDSSNIFITKDIMLADLNSNINFNLLLYIDKEGTSGGYDFFANKEGLVFGRVEFFKLKFGGVSSMFPIVEISEKNGPLWSVVLNYNDIYDDDFSEENLKIVLNKAHKSYSYLQENNKDYNPLFLAEVLSSSISTLITQIIHNEDDKLILTKSSSDGSIAQALKYFNDTLNFNISNDYLRLYESVKLYFDREFK